MAIIEQVSRVTFRSLMNKSKADLARDYLGWLDADVWHSIDSAPKDGREVLLVVKMRAGIPHGRLVGHYMRGGHCIDGHPPIDAGWYFWNGCMFDKAAEPVRWRPLPDYDEPAAVSSSAPDRT